MTQDQYKTYSKINEEIKAVKMFLECGCGLTRNEFLHQIPFGIIVRERYEKRWFFERKWNIGGRSENEFEIPKSLQFELALTAEKWLKQHEDFLQNI